MIKKVKFLIFFLIFILFSSCSFDDKTGIWSGGEEERRRISELERRQNVEVVKIYTSKNVYSEEILSTKNIILTTPKKNN